MKSGKKTHKATLECSPNGPYLVKGLENLTNSKGDSLPTKSLVALCRCGGSGNKPFCDGTHTKISFSGARLTDGTQDHRKDYVGKQITIHDNRGLCAHAGFCTDSLASVFRSEEDPWIDPDRAKVEQIAEAIKKCPSGALSYTVAGVEYRDQDREPMITVTKDGPYAVTGGIELLDRRRGKGASAEHYTLCRCGGSKNKPFCDGTHWSIEFKDDKN